MSSLASGREGVYLVQWYLDITLFAFCLMTTISIAYRYHMLKGRMQAPKGHSIKNTWTVLFRFKALFTVVLVFYSIVELKWWTKTHSSYLFDPICLLTAAIASLFLLFFDKNWSATSSPLQFIFCLVLVIGTAPTFKVQVEELIAQEKMSWMDITRAFTLFPVSLILLFLNSFADLERPLTKDDPPEDNCSFPSTLVYGWLDRFIIKGFHNIITFGDLLTPPKSLHVEKSAEAFLTLWSSLSNKQGTSGSIWLVLFKQYGVWYLCTCILIVFKCMLTFVGPAVLKLLVRHVDSDEETWKGFLYVAIMFASQVICTLCWARALHELHAMSLQLRSNTLSLIYRKALRLSNKSRSKYTIGKVTNYMAVDVQRIMTAFPNSHHIWSSPFEIILALIFLYLELGPVIFAGIGTFLLIIIVNAICSYFVKKWETTKLKAKDQRIKLMNEIISGIKVLKLHAWEIPFMQRIFKIRDVEIAMIKKSAYYFGATASSCLITPIIVNILMFGTYVAIDPTRNVLTADKVFVCVSLVNNIRRPLTKIPYSLNECIKLVLSINRIGKFLSAEELDKGNLEKANNKIKSNNSMAIQIREAYYTWNDEKDEPIIKNFSLDVKRGSLVAVVGTVGSGKSSLLAAMLGEMHCKSGTTMKDGKVAYVPQQPWIQNMSLKSNILFSSHFDEDRYDRVIKNCVLTDDLTILPSGDMTEIGENGINLSGGQKQRISLARAVYSDADIYFLDDPLSAVDAHVGQQIFDHVIGPTGMLKEKTRILVTHGITHLPQADNIIVLEDMSVREQGPYQELIEKKGAFAEFMKKHMAQTKRHNMQPSCTPHESKSNSGTNKRESEKFIATTSPSGEGKLVAEELAIIGEVKWTHFKKYFKNVGFIPCLILLCLYGVKQFFTAGTNYILSCMSDENESVGYNSNVLFYLGMYFIFGGAESVSEPFREVITYRLGARASDRIHKTLLYRLLRCPISFFDTNPTGRILNRFSGDMDVLDGDITNSINTCIWCFFDVLATIVVITSVTPMFASVLLPMGALYILVTKYYMMSARQVKRLESISKSPIYAHFSESLSGTVSIRAYKVEERFITKLQNRVQTNINCSYLSLSCSRWLTVRLELIGSLIVAFSSIFAILTRDELSAGIAGLSISYALTITFSLNLMLIRYSELEMNSVALERIMEYIDNAGEAEWETQFEDSQLPKGWPDRGSIKFQSYQMRYREELDLVFDDFNIKMGDGEKIGICGRTGSGKSSLALALFRIIEPAGGHIMIDGIDISALGLHTLRSRLTIIPQDPVIFTGKLRFNLDPTGECSDLELWNALEMSHLKSHIETLPGGLDHEINEGGAKFSMGQRQLICLARALLRKTRILILDEATASVDLDTDAMIQATIKDSFAKCTVLTIAHRLRTILDSSRIAVLSKGKLEEMGTPKDLLSNQNSAFSFLFNKVEVDAPIL